MEPEATGATAQCGASAQPETTQGRIAAVCQVCGNSFLMWRVEARRGRKFCSRACVNSPRPGHHGESWHRSPEYNTWRCMRRRCDYPKHIDFHRYGGRGIRVCDRWLKFENFLADMGRKPGPDYSLDRIDNERGYEPGNCRWVTSGQQARNRSTNRWFTIAGETLTLTDWVARYGARLVTVRGRLRRGWAIADALRGRTS